MSTIDYLPFGTGGGANVIDQATFAAASWVGSGFEAGLAQSNQLNKVWRQSSVMSAALATFISNQLGIDVLDDGNLAALVTNLTSAITRPMPSYENLTVTATGNTGATLTADIAILQNAGGNVLRLANVNIANVATANGANGIDVGSALTASADWHLFTIYNPTTLTTASLVSASATAPTLPAGYTFFGYAGTLKTDAASHFLLTLQRGRRTQYVVNTNPTTLPVIASGASGTLAAPTVTQVRGVGAGLVLPANAVELDFSMYGFSSSNANVQTAGLWPNNHYAANVTANPQPFMFVTGGFNYSFAGSMLLESNNVYYYGSVAGGGGNNVGAYCRGWTNPVMAS